jgi:opacity protein-like surface antigen
LKHRSCLFLLPVLISSLTTFAQDSKSDFSLNLTGTYTKNSGDSFVSQGATKSAGFLASYRFSFTPHQAVEANYGYSKNSQNYFNGDFISVQAGVHELTGAYVLKASNSRFSPFALAGTGALIFSPTSNVDPFLGASTQARAVFLYGAGADYNLSSHFGIRAQYRGLVYKAPDFGISGLQTDAVTHMAEPSIGLVFRF